jgi:hypothetical protein
MNTAQFWLSILGCVAGCTTDAGKPPLTDDFSGLAGKGDGFSSSLQIIGTLTNGNTSDPVAYSNPPLYRAFTFTGKAGDAIEAWVRSTDGDAVAWLLDSSLNVIVQADDSGGTTDSYLTTTLANPSPDTFYIVFREFSDHAATFRVTLKGSSDAPVERTLKAVTVHPYDACVPNCPSWMAGWTDVPTTGLGSPWPTAAAVGFVAVATYSDGSTEDVTQSATWSSTDLGTLSFNGTVTSPYVFEWVSGVAPGTATLVATQLLPSSTVGVSGMVTLNVH